MNVSGTRQAADLRIPLPHRVNAEVGGLSQNGKITVFMPWSLTARFCPIISCVAYDIADNYPENLVYQTRRV